MDGAQEAWLRRIGLDLPAQPRNREVDGARRRAVDNPPHLAQQLVAMHDMVPALRQVSQDLEFPVCQVQRRRAAASGAGFEIDLDPTEMDTRHHEYGPAQYRVDPRRQLLHVERLVELSI